MKKIFVDVYLMFNLGDDLFLDILVKRYPNCQFTVNYLGKNYDEFLSRYSNVKRRNYTLLNKIGQKLKVTDSITNYDKVSEEHDALLFIGGSIFREENYQKELYNDRLKMVEEFKKRNKPTFVLGANFGPCKTENFYKQYYKLFGMCEDVCFRDTFSFELFKSIKQIRHSPDIVFGLDISTYKKDINSNIVGFSIVNLNHKDNISNYENEYIESTVNSIEMLISKGYRCCLLSFCEKEGDLETINKIKSFLSPNILKYVSTYEYKGNIEETISLISTFRLLVAARFHANILALMLGVGILPIIYSNKTLNMLKDIGLSDLYIEMKNLKLQAQEDMVKKAFENKMNIEKLTSKSVQQFKFLDYFIQNKVMEEV
jgi:colanic acid/amylovoran biosynthesis protein